MTTNYHQGGLLTRLFDTLFGRGVLERIIESAPTKVLPKISEEQLLEAYKQAIVNAEIKKHKLTLDAQAEKEKQEKKKSYRENIDNLLIYGYVINPNNPELRKPEKLRNFSDEYAGSSLLRLSENDFLFSEFMIHLAEQQKLIINGDGMYKEGSWYVAKSPLNLYGFHVKFDKEQLSSEIMSFLGAEGNWKEMFGTRFLLYGASQVILHPALTKRFSNFFCGMEIVEVEGMYTGETCTSRNHRITNIVPVSELVVAFAGEETYRRR